MIDYRPIADAMRHCKYKTTKAECESCSIHEICKNYKGFIEDYAAEIIGHLQAERDAAVAEIKVISPCYACKYADEPNESEHCYGCHGGNWEWSGVNHD